MIWSRYAIRQIILDMALKVMQQPFTGSADFYQIADSDLKNDLGLDSIEIMGLAAHVNSFFNLFEIGKPPYLLSSSSVDDWVDMVWRTRQNDNKSLSFNTSGTSGTTKTITHNITYLDREITFLSTIFDKAACVIPYVPSYTIYGFLLTVGLPQALNIPVVYPSEINWLQLPPNALIVGTPFNWQLLINSLSGIQLNCLGVSAAAPLPQSLYQDINSKGIALTELYGSTETSGIACRNFAHEPFRFFPYWNLLSDGKIYDVESGEKFMLMDDIEKLSDNTFNLIGRKDKQVKIAGMLVDLGLVESSIKQLPNVKQCTISAKNTESGIVIQAVITLINNHDQSRDDVKTLIRETLPSHQRPQQIYFS